MMRKKLLNCYQYKKNNYKGFTLLEALVAIFITMFTLLVINHLFWNIKQVEPYLEHNQQVEWHIFLNQLEHETSDLVFATSNKDYLLFKEKKSSDKNTTYFYQHYGKLIRRQRNFTGHQPMLMDVQSTDFEQISDDQLKLEVTFVNGDTYLGIIPIEKEGD